MNDLHHPCKSWAEQISLAASGCLSSDEEREVRRHIETCPGCRERFRQLTELCGTLAEVQLSADDPESAIVERVMSAVRSDDSEIIHPNFLTRSLDNWRWIMHSPVSRVAAVAIFVFSVVGSVLWFQGPGATPAFADVAKRILEMKIAKFVESHKVENVPNDGQSRLGTLGDHVEVLWCAPDLYRREHKANGKICQVSVSNPAEHKSMDLFPGTFMPGKKFAMVTEVRNLDKLEKLQKQAMIAGPDIMEDIRELLQKKDPQVESLGEKEIDGHQAIGYRVTKKGNKGHYPTQMDVWADSKTLWPVYIETSTTLPEGVVSKTILSKFEYNVKVDKSLFSVKPPADYTVQYNLFDPSPNTEKDLIEMLREYSKGNDGHFLESMDYEKIRSLFEKYTPVDEPGKKRLSESQKREKMEMNLKIQRGNTFFGSLPVESDARYAGKGVSFGEANKPIAWYRPKGAKKYRVIYGDLNVKELTPDEMKAFPEGERNGMFMMEECRKAEMEKRRKAKEEGKEGVFEERTIMVMPGLPE